MCQILNKINEIADFLDVATASLGMQQENYVKASWSSTTTEQNRSRVRKLSCFEI